MKTQVTNKELALFNVNAQNYAAKYPDQKLSKVLEKVRKANIQAINQYQEDCDEANIDFASVDAKQNLVYADAACKIYAYTKENKKLLGQKIKEINLAMVDVTYKHMAEADLPKDLHDEFREVFTPFVIAPVAEMEIAPE